MYKMTDSRAVEVLAVSRRGGAVSTQDYNQALDHAIDRLREPAEAQTQVGGEVVAWRYRHRDGKDGWFGWILAKEAPSKRLSTSEYQPLYTAPPSAPVGVEGFTEKHGVDLRGITVGEVLTQDQWDAVCAFVREQEAIIDDRDERLEALAQQPAPSAPVGVEDKARAMFEAMADNLAAPWERQWAPTKDFWRKCAAEALSQQPAAVDGAMVERALSARAGAWTVRQLFADEDEAPDIMRIALTAALAAQPGGDR